MIYIETATFALSIIIVRQQLSIWLKEAWIPAFTLITTINLIRFPVYLQPHRILFQEFNNIEIFLQVIVICFMSQEIIL